MDNDEVLDALFTALNVLDPPPERVKSAALAAHHERAPAVTLHRVDSDDLKAARAGMRGTDDLVDMTFRAGTLECNLSIETSKASWFTSGTVAPRPGKIMVHVPGREPFDVEVDEFGRFDFELEGALGLAVSFVDENGGLGRTPLIELN